MVLSAVRVECVNMHFLQSHHQSYRQKECAIIFVNLISYTINAYILFWAYFYILCNDDFQHNTQAAKIASLCGHIATHPE